MRTPHSTMHVRCRPPSSSAASASSPASAPPAWRTTCLPGHASVPWGTAALPWASAQTWRGEKSTSATKLGGSADGPKRRHFLRVWAKNGLYLEKRPRTLCPATNWGGDLQVSSCCSVPRKKPPSAPPTKRFVAPLQVPCKGTFRPGILHPSSRSRTGYILLPGVQPGETS